MRWVVVISFAALALGCAHADAVGDRQIAEMRDSLGKLESDQDKENQRFGLAEGAADGQRETGADAKTAATPKTPATAAPRAVQLGEDGDDHESDDPNDPSARPEIRVQGPAGAASRPSRSKNARVEDPPSSSSLSTASSGSNGSTPIFDPEAKRAYESALALARDKKCDRALDALAAFLVRYPDHPYAENAMYWRGECFYGRGEYLRAAEQFEAVLTRGLGAKSADALLKIGMCHERLGASDRAREYWDRLRREYPRSDAARRIPDKSDKSEKSKESR